VDFPVAYYHLSDNDGERDLHLLIGKGTIDWTQLKGLNKAIIEVNDCTAVKESRDHLAQMIRVQSCDLTGG
jgi:sugar phosphate isomerase/epimerase